MRCDPEVWRSLAAISHVATRSQRGCLNLDWLTPPFVPFRSVDGCVMHFLTSSKSTSRYRVSTINFSFKCPVLLGIQGKRKNRVWQRTHRQGTKKKRLSIHSNAPCLLERRISEHPHFKHTIGFMAACIRTFASSYD